MIDVAEQTQPQRARTSLMYNFAGEIARSIERIGPVGRIFYTRRQLYYEFCRVVRERFLPFPPLRRARSARPPISIERFDLALNRHTARHGTPEGLLETPGTVHLSIDGREPDLADYGLLRLLICEDGEITGMLIANGIHIELSCAILGLRDSVPLPDFLCAMLARADQAQVYFLHNADSGSLSLVRVLPRRLGLPRGIPLSSIGLRPAHAIRMRLAATRHKSTWALHAVALPGLTDHEEVWLRSGWRVEVAAVRPVDLLRIVRNAVASPPGVS